MFKKRLNLVLLGLVGFSYNMPMSKKAAGQIGIGALGLANTIAAYGDYMSPKYTIPTLFVLNLGATWLKLQIDLKEAVASVNGQLLSSSTLAHQRLSKIVDPMDFPDHIIVAGPMVGCSTAVHLVKGCKNMPLQLNHSDFLALNNPNTQPKALQEIEALVAHELGHTRKHIYKNQFAAITEASCYTAAAMFGWSLLNKKFADQTAKRHWSKVGLFCGAGVVAGNPLATNYVIRKHEYEGDQNIIKVGGKPLAEAFVRWLIRINNYAAPRTKYIFCSHPTDPQRAKAMGLDYDQIRSEVLKEQTHFTMS